MNLGLKFRDLMTGRLGQVIREELDALVASISQHWLVGHNADGSHKDLELDAASVDSLTVGTGTGYLKASAGLVTTQTTPIPTADLGSGAASSSTFLRGDQTWASAGFPDGDYGDITVGGSGTTMTIDDGAVDNAALADMATQTLKGRKTAGTGDPEDFKVSDLTTEASPTSGDYLLMEESGGNLRKVDWASLPGAGSGEANTASNVGTGGVGVWKQKTGVDLEFKKINAGSAAITITDDVANSEVDVDLGTVNTTDLADFDPSAPSGGDVLRYYSVGGYWESIPGFFHRDSGRQYYDIAGAASKTADYTALTTDFMITFYSSSSLTCNLYAVSGNYARALIICNQHPTGTVTIDPNSTELIDNASTKVLAALSACLIYCDGSSWTTILSTNLAPPTHNHAASEITSGTMATARLGSGSASSSTFLRGDQTWDTPTASVGNDPVYTTLARGGTSGATVSCADAQMYATCLGKLNASVSSVTVSQHVQTAIAGTITYAEIGIGKGTPTFNGSLPTITPVGHTDVSTTYNGTGSKQTTISVAGGQTLGSGDWLWILFVQSASSTNASLGAVADMSVSGVHGYKASAGQISTSIGTGISGWTTSAYSIPNMAAMATVA